MRLEKLLPTVMIVLSLASSIGYGFAGDWRKAIYWLAAATLNFCVTW